MNGFILRQDQKHRKVKKMATIGPLTKNHMDYNQQKGMETCRQRRKCKKSKLEKLKITDNKEIF